MAYALQVLEVTPATYDEIEKKIKAAGWVNQLTGPGMIDMFGLALSRGEPVKNQWWPDGPEESRR